MCDVCMEATRCVFLPLFLYTMKLCAFVLQNTHNFIMYKNNGNERKMFLNKNHASRVGEKVLKQDDLISDIPTCNTVHFYNPTSL